MNMWPNFIIVAALGIYFILRTIKICWPFGGWLIIPALFMGAGTCLAGLGFGFVVWNLWIGYAALRWEPVRGLYRVPRWPRATYQPGPGRGRPRDFRQPPLWDRGPCTY